jgi:cytochrome c peroxidase
MILIVAAFSYALPANAADGYVWQLPEGFPVPRVPDDNPMTAAKVELGRYLFYDERLSGNETASCATCHKQALAFTDGRTLALGSTGMFHPRNTQTLTNAAYNATYTWANPVLLTLERQIPIPMFGDNPVELGITGREAQVLARFKADNRYQRLFAAAFPSESDPITYANIVKSLASFTRTLVSGNSRFDKYRRGDITALNASEVRGMRLFLGESLECHHCHTGFNFTLSTVHANTTQAERPFQNTGLYNIDGKGAYPVGNRGIFEITNKPGDMGKFRAPTLRNIGLTAPYMHDGSLKTLDEVIDFYSKGGRVIEKGENAGDGRTNPFKSGFVAGFELSAQERADLKAFLLSLTDESFVTDPRFSNPFKP